MIKTIMVTFMWLLLAASGVLAAPFLKSDPYGHCGQSGQSACPVSATIYMDGAVIADDVQLQPDLSISYDLLTMPDGEHEFTATYDDELGRPSDPSNPYLLLPKPASPKSLRGTAIP